MAKRTCGDCGHWQRHDQTCRKECPPWVWCEIDNVPRTIACPENDVQAEECDCFVLKYLPTGVSKVLQGDKTLHCCDRCGSRASVEVTVGNGWQLFLCAVCRNRHDRPSGLVHRDMHEQVQGELDSLQGVVDAIDRVLQMHGVHHASQAVAIELIICDRDKMRTEVAELKRKLTESAVLDKQLMIREGEAP